MRPAPDLKGSKGKAGKAVNVKKAGVSIQQQLRRTSEDTVSLVRPAWPCGRQQAGAADRGRGHRDGAWGGDMALMRRW